MQAAQRRKKKRFASHSLKTVELIKGRHGYGFTISGQQPCILSCIVCGSPADQAGLRTGDYLMSVNGLSIGNAPHDHVVRLIGSSHESLRLEIAEKHLNDSDSSDDDYRLKPKSKCPNRVRPRQAHQRADRGPPGREKTYGGNDKYMPMSKLPISEMGDHEPVDDFEAEFQAAFQNIPKPRARGIENRNPQARKPKHSVQNLQGGPMHAGAGTKHTIITREYRMVRNNSNSDNRRNPKLHAHVEYQSPPGMSAQNWSKILYPSNQQDSPGSRVDDPDGESMHRDLDTKRFVVGYLGTVEMPIDANLPNSRLQSIRSAVRRLRKTQKVHTLVMMDVNKNGVSLQNAIGNTVATYTADKVAFSGVCPDDERFFGIVTFQNSADGNRGEESMSGSACHVYMVDPVLSSHRVHAQKARNLGIQCTVDPETQRCFEFPQSATPLLEYILNLYKDNLGGAAVNGEANQHARQESASSNSDSGLGFARDEKANDQVCVVELPQNVSNEDFSGSWDLEESGSSAFALYQAKLEQELSTRCHGTGMSDLTSGSSMNASSSSQVDSSLSFAEKMSCRARPQVGKDSLEAQNSADNLRLSMQKYMRSQQLRNEHMSDVDSLHSNESNSSHSQAGFSASPKIVDSRALSSRHSQSSLSSTMSAKSENDPNDQLMNDPLYHDHKLSPRVFPTSVTPRKTDSVGGSTPEGHQPSAFKAPMFKPPLPNTRPPQAIKGKKYVKPQQHLRTPPHNSAEFRPGRPKSTPPFKRNTYFPSVSSDEEYDSDPGSVCRSPVIERKDKWNGVLTEIQLNAHNERRCSEGFALLRKKEIDEESLASTISSRIHRGSSLKQTKPKKWSNRCSSHESLVVTESPYADESRLSCATSAHHITQHVDDKEEEDEIPIGRAASWAVSFEKLLADKAGLATFTEFLKKEFSEENIEFWTKCEDYKALKTDSERAVKAKEIFDYHLCAGASSPVNVDSHAVQVTQDKMQQASIDLFNTAQKQIFQLMKMDSYSRFLKSDLYKECVVADMEGKPLPYTGQQSKKQPEITPMKDKTMKEDKKLLRKSKSASVNVGEEGQEKRRKSLLMLPWNKKSEKKLHKMNTDSELHKMKNLQREDRTISNGSINSAGSVEVNDINKLNLDGKESQKSSKDNQKFCRVILPDGSTTVVYAKQGQTVKSVLQRLCDRRTLVLATLEVLLVGTDTIVDLLQDISTMGSKEIQLSKRVLFCVDLPSRKTIGVRARAEKTIQEVLQPVLTSHSIKLSDMVVHVSGTGVLVDTETAVSAIDNQRVAIQSMEDFQEWGGMARQRAKPPLPSKVNGVERNAHSTIQGWFQAKSNANLKFDTNGVIDLSQRNDESSTESKSSGLFGLIRKNSIGDKDSKKLKKAAKGLSEKKSSKPTPTKNAAKKSADDTGFIDLLCKVQDSRMDDQRGLSAQDLELPDFLKVDKSKDDSNLSRPKSAYFDSSISRNSSLRLSKSSDTLDTDGTSSFGSSEASHKFVGSPRSNKIPFVDSSFSSDSVVPPYSEAEQYFTNTSVVQVTSPDFNDSHLMEKSLTDIGMCRGKPTVGKPRMLRQQPLPITRNAAYSSQDKPPACRNLDDTLNTDLDQTIQEEFIPPPPLVTCEEENVQPPAQFQGTPESLDDCQHFRSPSSRRVQRLAPKRGQQSTNSTKSLPDFYSFSEEQSHLSNEFKASPADSEMASYNLEGAPSIGSPDTPSPTTHDLVLDPDLVPPPDMYQPMTTPLSSKNMSSPLERFIHFDNEQDYQASYV